MKLTLRAILSNLRGLFRCVYKDFFCIVAIDKFDSFPK